MCRDSSVGIVTHFGLGDRRTLVRSPAGCRGSFLVPSTQISSAVHPTSYPVCARDYSPGRKAVGHEADHSPPSSAEVQNGGGTPPLFHKSSRRGA
jgi:hypothetical protein